MNTLKLGAASAATLALCMPALAQAAVASDTVKAAVEHGTKIDVMGMVYEQTYKADGTYAGAGDDGGGKYRVDGKKVCLTPEALGQELCMDYPDGKKSGDSFEVQSDFGAMTITIK